MDRQDIGAPAWSPPAPRLSASTLLGAASSSVVAVPDEDRTRLLDSLETDLAEVELALARLDAGTYETCEICGGPIPDEELVTAPTARHCTTCPSSR